MCLNGIFNILMTLMTTPEMKHEWKKHEKQFYLPGDKPELVTVPPFRFFNISGKGNPNDEFFGEYTGVLYSLSYAVRFSRKQGIAPAGYFEYANYPLEGIWDIAGDAKKNYYGEPDKDSLLFNLMMRQPDFVTGEFALEIIERTKKRKPHKLLDRVKFLNIEDGPCVQMLHKGSFDTEPESFGRMEAFTMEQGLERAGHIHREIYLTDTRKVSQEKYRTVLRFQVK